jgi:hypothetical protein
MLRGQCTKALALAAEYGMGRRRAEVSLRLKGVHKREHRRLWGRGGGPLGRVVGFERDWQVVAFDAREVLAAVDKLAATTEE